MTEILILCAVSEMGFVNYLLFILSIWNFCDEYGDCEVGLLQKLDPQLVLFWWKKDFTRKLLNLIWDFCNDKDNPKFYFSPFKIKKKERGISNFQPFLLKKK